MPHKRSTSDIPLFHQTYALYKLIDAYSLGIPKAKRYTLWNRCETAVLTILESIIAAGHYFGEKQLETLRTASIELDLLKVFIRLAKETHCIDSKQYLEIEMKVQEIGKMLGGWIKFASR
jgi:four helix bundle protein